jgi:hypothetical protein
METGMGGEEGERKREKWERGCKGADGEWKAGIYIPKHY